MIFAIFAFWFGYKKAKATGRNAVAWSLLCGGGFLGAQLLVSLAGGVALGLGGELYSWSEETMATYELIITIVAIAVSILTVVLLFRYLDRVPDEPIETPPPPPPVFPNDANI